MEFDILPPFPQEFTTRTQPESDKSVSFNIHLSTIHRPRLDQTYTDSVLRGLDKNSPPFPFFAMQVSQASPALGLCTMCNSARYLLNEVRVCFLQNRITWL